MDTIGWRDCIITSYTPKIDKNGYRYLELDLLFISDRERGRTAKIELTKGPVSQKLLESIFTQAELINLGSLAEWDLWDLAFLLFERKFSGLLTVTGYFKDFRHIDDIWQPAKPDDTPGELVPSEGEQLPRIDSHA